MRCDELPVYAEAWQLIKTMDKYIVNFQREFKYSHGEKLRELGIDLIKYLCLANDCSSNRAKRVEYLEMALGTYEAYKFTKRLAVEMKCMSHKAAAVVDKHIACIGGQLMAWKKSSIKTDNETKI